MHSLPIIRCRNARACAVELRLRGWTLKRIKRFLTGEGYSKREIHYAMEPLA